MTTKIIYGPRAAELRNPQAEQKLISFVLDLGGTDMMRCDAIVYLVQSWCDQGGEIATACGQVLDTERAEYTGEARLYNVEGRLVVLERNKDPNKNVYLACIDDCFGASPRRCINHMRARRGQVSTRRVCVGHLPRYFWISVAMQIFDLNFS
ncbi:hypothetical protein [Leisingera aquaemixtae]|uniref:Uncharacterized protein n=1 Tax=Leisingera aquaemixtae TaxID=1396826 RepID=A0A0N7M5A3_9RHOB|nr:hypothetical protein [Leisingera aquaemixtae]CUI01874.1 hypothetical protein PHA8399_04023 [Leisingera aquaemixtae]